MSLAPSPASVKPSASSRLAGEKNSSLVERLIRAGCRPVSPASLAAFRIAFGLIGLIAVVRFVANGWVDDVYILPAYHFTYARLRMDAAMACLGDVPALCPLGSGQPLRNAGLRYRLSIIAFFLLFTYVELIDQTTYLNHYYLVSLLSLIMVFLPMASVASLDSVCRGNRGGDGGGDSPSGRVVGTTVPVAALWALRVQLALVYVFAGVAKLNPDWLLHAQPLTIWLYNSADTPFIGAFVREQWLAYALSWAGVFFDLTIVGWLLWRRTRPYAFAALVVFHVSTAVLFPAIGMFPWIMIGATLVFFNPDWPVDLDETPARSICSHGYDLFFTYEHVRRYVSIVAGESGIPAGSCISRGAGPSAAETPSLPRRRAMDGRRLSLFMEGAGHREDRLGTLPCDKLRHRWGAAGVPGRLPDSHTGRADCIPAGLGAGYGPHHPRRLRPTRPSWY